MYKTTIHASILQFTLFKLTCRPIMTRHTFMYGQSKKTLAICNIKLLASVLAVENC